MVGTAGLRGESLGGGQKLDIYSEMSSDGEREISGPLTVVMVAVEVVAHAPALVIEGSNDRR